MHGLTAWKENEIRRFRRDLDAIFKRRCQDFGIPFFMEAPDIHLELSETGSELILTAQLSGILPEDIDISASEDSITIRVETRSRNVTEDEHFRRIEKKSSAFRRRISLPVRVKVEDVQAVYEKQILRIVMPKYESSRKRLIKPQIK